MQLATIASLQVTRETYYIYFRKLARNLARLAQLFQTPLRLRKTFWLM